MSLPPRYEFRPRTIPQLSRNKKSQLFTKDREHAPNYKLQKMKCRHPERFCEGSLLLSRALTLVTRSEAHEGGPNDLSCISRSSLLDADNNRRLFADAERVIARLARIERIGRLIYTRTIPFDRALFNQPLRFGA